MKDDQEALQKRFIKEMNVRARASRIRLDNYVKLHHYSAELFVTQKRFVNYLNKTDPSQSPGNLLNHNSTPPWFPDRSIQRTYIKSHHFLLLDSAGLIREKYSRRGKSIPEQLNERIKHHNTILMPTESWFAKLDTGLFLITSQSLKKAGNPFWNRLLLVTEVDDEFIFASQGLLATDDLFALIDNETQTVMVSSDIELIPVESKIESLQKNYLIGSESFFDYGNSDVIIKLVVLVPRIELENLLNQVDQESKRQVVMISTTFIITFILVFLWFILHLNRFTQKMVTVSKNNLGITAPTAAPGGPLERLQNQFNLLSVAILQARERERLTQIQLAKSEMMAALGDLVAGVAHEINTPLGISYTSATFLNGNTKKIHTAWKDQELTRSDLESYMELATESTELIEKNLARASNLVSSFKMVAVDQGRNDQRTFNIKEYIEEILVNLRPKWKRTSHSIHLTSPDDLIVNSFPGAISQIISNLVVNSLLHAFPEKSEGKMHIDITKEGDMVILNYSDNGCGMTKHGINKVFEPFFTTARDRGGSGLGMHIVFNLVTQALNGTIECKSELGAGVNFKITFPVTAPKQHGAKSVI
ncbi:MAG: HAMP domain-containing histidine kinase [Magnetococcales bacterium]|nr:HAMP domain-containing histidine kinase [Magnetococcales bacterium]